MSQELSKNNIENFEFFYFPNTKELLMIPRYYTNGSGMLDSLIDNLQKSKQAMLKYLPKDTDIYTSEIFQSRRYKSKWYFKAELDKCPAEGVYEVKGDSWSADRWIQN